MNRKDKEVMKAIECFNAFKIRMETFERTFKRGGKCIYGVPTTIEPVVQIPTVEELLPIKKAFGDWLGYIIKDEISRDADCLPGYEAYPQSFTPHQHY